MDISNDMINQDCEEMVYSNQYADYIINFYGDVTTISRRYQADCAQIIDGTTAIIHKKLEEGQTILAETFGYSAIPKCFGLLDTSSMESSGILRLRRQPYVGFQGRNVLIGFVDTGERVIIMLSE